MTWYQNLAKTVAREWRRAGREIEEAAAQGARAVNDGEKMEVAGWDVVKRLVSPELANRKNFLEEYHKSLYVFACISKIAMKASSVPLKLYKILDSKGDTQELQTHPLLDLLYRPNPFQTRTEFFEITFINLKCTGDAFWYKARNKSGKVAELWNLRPDYVTIVSDPEKFIKAYEFAKTDGTKVTFAPEDIVHHKYVDPLSQYFGMSPIRPAAKRVQIEEHANRWQADFFLNNSRPDALIKNKNETLTKTQKEDLREGWAKLYKGPGNSSKVAILEGGLEYQLISLTQKEMDFIESMRFTRDDILVAFSVPKSIVAITDDVNRANAETGMAIFLSETIKPEVARLVEKINEEMTYLDFGEEFFIDYVDPTPANRELVLKEYETGLTQNYLLINEVRAKEGLPPVKGGWSFYRPLMDVAVGGLPQKGEPKAMRIGGDSEMDAYERIAEVKRYDFKGRFWLRVKMELFETAMDAATKALKKRANKKPKENRKSGKAKVTGHAILPDAEKKKQYADIINKEVDGRTLKLKDGVDAFAEKQHGRVAKALEDVEEKSGKTKKVTVTVEQIFDESAEVGLAIEFVTPYLSQFLTDAAAGALRMVAPQTEFEMTKRIQSIIKRRAAEFASETTRTTMDKLSGTLAEGIAADEGVRDLANRVDAVYEDFPAYRSELIARTEATAANNEGILEGFKQSDVSNAKEWINAGDARVREEHMDSPVGVGGEIIANAEAFSNGLMFPSEPNCRCVLGPAWLED